MGISHARLSDVLCGIQQNIASLRLAQMISIWHNATKHASLLTCCDLFNIPARFTFSGHHSKTCKTLL